MENPSTSSGPSANPNPSGAPPAVENHTLLAALAYIGPLVIVSYLIGKENPFVKFHIKQGLVLLVIEILVYIASIIMPFFLMIFWLIHLGTFILSIVGIVNAVQSKEKELPLVGKFASHFKF